MRIPTDPTALAVMFTALASATIVLTWTGKGLRRLFRGLRGAYVSLRKIDLLVDAAEPLLAMSGEFKNNGGSTLRDAVDKIESAAKLAAEKALKAESAAHKAEMSSLELQRRQEALHEEVSALAEVVGNTNRIVTELVAMQDASTKAQAEVIDHRTKLIPPP